MVLVYFVGSLGVRVVLRVVLNEVRGLGFGIFVLVSFWFLVFVWAGYSYGCNVLFVRVVGKVVVLRFLELACGGRVLKRGVGRCRSLSVELKYCVFISFYIWSGNVEV